MKVIVHKGKHCNTAFPETDAGWLMFFDHMKDDEEYYRGISSGVDIADAKQELKTRMQLKRDLKKTPEPFKELAKERVADIPRYERELATAERQKVLYTNAIQGGRDILRVPEFKAAALAAKNLAYARHDYEYEDFEILEVRES
jgi:hypothetical protein